MRRSGFLVGTALFVVAFALLACVGDERVGSINDDAGAGSSSAGVPKDNVKENASFESGCSAWSTDRATLTPSTTAHTGTGSCLLCATDDEGVYTMTGRIATDKLASNSYYQARVWLRTPDDKKRIPSRELRIVLFIDNQPDPSDIDGPITDEAQTAPLTDDYKEAVSNKLQFVAGQNARSFAMQIIERQSGPKACFLVDDFSLTPVTGP